MFTTDGLPVHFPSASDHFPDAQTNVVPLQESMGAYNALQQSDVHAYWEFNYLGTNWIHPLYELPFTGGFPDDGPGFWGPWSESAGVAGGGRRCGTSRRASTT